MMKSMLKILVVIQLILSLVSPAFAIITFTNGYWSTSFEGIGDWTHTTTPTTLSNGLTAYMSNCAGPCTEVSWGCSPSVTFPCTTSETNSAERVIYSANNPGGVAGSSAQVHYFYTGATGAGSNNNNSGGLYAFFPETLQELWIRYYVYYPTDATIVGWKILYFYDENGYTALWEAQPYNYSFYGGYFLHGSGASILSTEYPASWMSDNDRQGYGQWIPIEVYVKNNTTGQNNGIYRVWRENTLIINKTDVNMGINGFGSVAIGSNGSGVKGPADTVVGIRFDDIAIATPNYAGFTTDNNGYNRIGLLNVGKTSGAILRKFPDGRIPRIGDKLFIIPAK